MPYSVSAESKSPGPIAPSEETMAESDVANGNDHQTPESDVDVDIAMAEVEPAAEEAPVASGDKKEVKLEDLFADVDSDDEFPSSKEPQLTPESSSPSAPPSPT